MKKIKQNQKKMKIYNKMINGQKLYLNFFQINKLKFTFKNKILIK